MSPNISELSLKNENLVTLYCAFLMLAFGKHNNFSAS